MALVFRGAGGGNRELPGGSVKGGDGVGVENALHAVLHPYPSIIPSLPPSSWEHRNCAGILVSSGEDGFGFFFCLFVFWGVFLGMLSHSQQQYQQQTSCAPLLGIPFLSELGMLPGTLLPAGGISPAGKSADLMVLMNQDWETQPGVWIEQDQPHM